MTQDNKTEYSKKARGKKALTQYNEIGKLQPQAIELEEAVLGAIILESSAYYAVNTILKQSSFYKEANGLIWKAITQLMDSKSPVDLLTIMQQRCLSISQRYILKANHNGGLLVKMEHQGVYQ